MKGTIFRVFLNKGYAFLRDSNGVSRFVHAKDVEPPRAFDTLREGLGVEFTPLDTEKGPRACEVKVLP